MAEWFEEWFGEEYLELYPHRDIEDATRLVALLQRELPWQRGWRVLDCACGAGRHMQALERAGAQVFGFDLSAALIRRAHQNATHPVVRADLRHLPFRAASMDLTVNLFTSFGYFSSDLEHVEALAEMLDTVRDNGWFAMDFLHPDAVRGSLVPAEVCSVAGRRIEIRRFLSDDGKHVRKQIMLENGRQFEERVRLFEATELEQMLEEQGAQVVRRFGDYSGVALGQGNRTILLAQVRR
jgi:SAM-dependent methyltransferase